MEELLGEMVAGSPSLVGVIIVAWMFLRALAKRDDTIKDIAEMFSNTTRENVEEAKSLKEVIGANSEIIKQCTDELYRSRTHQV